MSDLSGLPSIDRLLKLSEVQSLYGLWGRQSVTQVLRSMQTKIRNEGIVPDWALNPKNYIERLEEHFSSNHGSNLAPVFNLAGTIIHTNLGRSILSEEMARAGLNAATQPVTLEFDLETGRRGNRDSLVEHLLCVLTGAEAATIVNNNAAAVLLVLNSLAENSPVPVSRGELVEIGGSFRIPEVMQKAGCVLVETGTTNRTHPKDYEQAIQDETRLLLKVHPSNYRVEGFTKSVSVSELSAIANKHTLPLYIDLGSGALIDLTKFGLPAEPTAREVLAQGADVISFSGDKLLGSIQAGIIVGKKELIDKIKSNPLKRALRVDKITLGILADTFKSYQDLNTVTQKIPLLATFSRPLNEIKQCCEDVAHVLSMQLPSEYKVTVSESFCQIGSGSMPDHRLPSWAVCVSAISGKTLEHLHATLRHLPVPVISRIQGNKLWMDMRTVDNSENLLTTLQYLKNLLNEISQ
ncbi:MAG: L-seryl-tRNA(Sec) selenium transferase [Pseudomonadales bacterium]|nr:L-seryl-tRNA(Sec) selenium transferase [Pseudomonadales bacterium]